MLINSQTLRLYLIADDKACYPKPLITAVEEVIDSGITCVQLRMKHQSLHAVYSQAKSLQKLLKPRNIPLIINDFVEVVQAVDAEGIHIGQTDKPYAYVRQQLGYKKIIGLSIQTIQHAEQCKSFDCDYFGVGPVFATSTKIDARPSIGIANLNKITSILSKPIVAIGGINENNINLVLPTQISGIALSAGIFSSINPQQTTQILSQLTSQSFYDAK
ncbi:MAG: thiamine phosphate synthase [Rickettsiella sp.]|nr:thiamine phosphate synthase [Rickettsiella sp.]